MTPGLLEHRPRARHIHAQRLLDQHVETGLEGRDGRPGMEHLGEGDQSAVGRPLLGGCLPARVDGRPGYPDPGMCRVPMGSCSERSAVIPPTKIRRTLAVMSGFTNPAPRSSREDGRAEVARMRLPFSHTG